EDLRRDILKLLDRAAARAAPDAHELFNHIRHLLTAEHTRSFDIGFTARRLLEFIVNDLLGVRENLELTKKIQRLADHGLADWIRSYMHVLKTFGNESAHDRETTRRAPANINEEDLTLCLSCLRRVLGFWVEYREGKA